MRKMYKIIQPDGVVLIIIGLEKYCRENLLSTGTMSSLSNGKLKQKHHKGYFCEHYIEDITKEAA
jgi:hypothetical protein